MAFGLNFFTLAPGLRVAGDSLAYAYKFTKKGGQGDGKEGLEVGLTDDPTIKLLEAAVSGYEQVSDRDAVYTTLVSGGLTEIVPGFAVGIDSLSSIDISTSFNQAGFGWIATAVAIPHCETCQRSPRLVILVIRGILPTATFADVEDCSRDLPV